MKAIKINITLTDGTLLPFEASRLNYKTAEELATLLKTPAWPDQGDLPARPLYALEKSNEGKLMTTSAAPELGFWINDADNHFNEPQDCFERYIDPGSVRARHSQREGS